MKAVEVVSFLGTGFIWGTIVHDWIFCRRLRAEILRRGVVIVHAYELLVAYGIIKPEKPAAPALKLVKEEP